MLNPPQAPRAPPCPRLPACTVHVPLERRSRLVELPWSGGRERLWSVRVDGSPGTRRAFLLLHGNPGTLGDWSELADPLSALGDVLAFDAPGFGRSDALPGGANAFSLDALADAAVALATQLDLRAPFHVVGHSHGGAVAQTIAVRHPALVAGIVLLGTLGHPAHRAYSLLDTPMTVPTLRLAGRMFRVRGGKRLARLVIRHAMVPIFAPNQVQEDAVMREVERMRARTQLLVHMAYLAQRAPSEQLLRQARQITVPVLLLHPEADRLVPPAYARAIHDALLRARRRSRFVALKGAGHMLLAFQAGAVIDEVTAWLREVGRTDAG